MRLVAGREYPLVRQFANTCGLASLAMVFLHHVPAAGPFLVDVHAARAPPAPGTGRAGTAGGKHPPVDRDRAMIWAEGYLLLRAARSRRVGNWLNRIGSEFEYEDFKLAVDMVLDGGARRTPPGFDTAMKYYRKGTIRRQVLDHYFSLYKTQHELRMLARMFGFSPVPYPGDTMGTLYFQRDDRDRAAKVSFIEEQLAKPDTAMLVGQGQSHWMVPHALFSANGATSKHVLGINDPMGTRTQLQLELLDNTHVFYFFRCRAGDAGERLAFLRTTLGLRHPMVNSSEM